MACTFKALGRWLAPAMLLALSACIDITNVTQPATGQVGTPFQVQVEGVSTEICATGSFPCRVVLAVGLPPGWVVESCSYSGDIAGTCSANSAAVPTTPASAGNVWRGFAGDAPPGAAAGTTATVTLQIRPSSAGSFLLDYIFGVDELLGTFRWGNASLAHPITIRSAPAVTAVPTLSVYGYGLMALGVAVATVRRRRSQRSSDIADR